LPQDSLLSDDLLRQLIAVGEVDLLVGIPTLNNAATIGGVVHAVLGAFAAYFPQDRTVLINSDGGSTDGTPAIVHDCSRGGPDTRTVSHTLRTRHSISTPYHGVPGKGNALRQILAAADLTQARAVAVLDADVISLTPDWIAALIGPVRDQGFDYVAPVYRRHPLDGPLITQIVRPLVRAAYGVRVQEPLAAEFGCSSRFLTHCLEQDGWDRELARYGIDLWVTVEALSQGFRGCQAGLGPRIHGAAARPGFQEVFEQVIGATFACLEQQADVWMAREGSAPLPVIGPSPGAVGDAPPVDGVRLTRSFCSDLQNLQSVLESILSPVTLAGLNQIAQADCEHLRYPDDLWASTVFEFLAAYHRGVMRREHIAKALIPLYLGRTGSFLLQYGTADPLDVEEALEALCLRFEQAKSALVERWTTPARGAS
jgi:hypothetical protein